MSSMCWNNRDQEIYITPVLWRSANLIWINYFGERRTASISCWNVSSPVAGTRCLKCGDLLLLGFAGQDVRVSWGIRFELGSLYFEWLTGTNRSIMDHVRLPLDRKKDSFFLFLLLHYYGRAPFALSWQAIKHQCQPLTCILFCCEKSGSVARGGNMDILASKGYR